MSMQPMDEFIEQKIEWLKKLKNCQEDQSIDSCLKCEMVIGCEIRNNYVKAVYFSMSKGEGVDFDF